MEFEKIKKDNRKKYIIGSLAILIIVSTIFFVATRANYKVTEKVNIANGTINYSPSDLNAVAIKISNDGTNYISTDIVPTSGYALSNSSYCEVNGTKLNDITMEYKEGKVFIPVNTKNTKCYLYFDKQKIVNEYLISKGEMIEENGYRYQGANPNNYVTFNNELWRIIGVFDIENNETSKTENLVKIIRNESIGEIAWDTEGSMGSNDWATSDIQTILNGQYYNGENINYTYRNPDNEYIDSSIVTIIGKSINDTARAMIQSVKWHLGTSFSEQLTTNQFYDIEQANSWNGYVGLMYVSDYGYAVDNASCSRTTILKNYSSNVACKSNNWLYNDSMGQWTLTLFGYGHPFSIHLIGDVDGSSASVQQYLIRPTLYLKSTVQITGGDGTSSNPYTLSM